MSPGGGGTLGGYVPASLPQYRLAGAMIGAGLNLNSLYSINPGAQDFYGIAIPHGVGSGYNVGAYGGAALGLTIDMAQIGFEHLATIAEMTQPSGMIWWRYPR